jgi:hypothetical protein
MVFRNRKHIVRYGGWPCGTSQSGAVTEPAFNGEHSCFDETHPGPPYRRGGPLDIRKKKVFLARSGSHYVFYHAILGWYNGHMGVRPYIPSVEPAPTNLSGWGAKGWNRTYPLHPIYQLGVSIGELKDLPGMVSQTVKGFQALRNAPKAFASAFSSVSGFLKHARSLPRHTGESYLYGAFGLAPMLQDLLFLLQMQEKLDKKLRWLRRHNGKSVRRKITLDETEYSEDIAQFIAPSTSCFPVLFSDCYAAWQNVPESMPILKTYKRRIWFSVKWRIHIPEMYLPKSPFKNSFSLIASLLGLVPDPSVIYKITPWSWLIDWFTSVGDVIANMSSLAKYGVVAEYAYVMCRETLTYKAPGRISLHSGKLSPSFQWVSPDWSWSGVSTTEYQFRKREEANPYGFGITWASLSNFQWSILAALGLTHGGFHAAVRT